MIDQTPESLVRGCNDPVSIGVLSDSVEEQYGVALDLDRSGWTDGIGYGDGFEIGDGCGCGNGWSNGNGYGSGNGRGYFST